MVSKRKKYSKGNIFIYFFLFILLFSSVFKEVVDESIDLINTNIDTMKVGSKKIESMVNKLQNNLDLQDLSLKRCINK